MRVPLAIHPVSPVVVIGFSKSGKSLICRSLEHSGLFARYPTEGNLRLFMPGLYPWHATRFDAPPVWLDPAPTSAYLRELYCGPHGRRVRRAVGLYEKIKGKSVILDNGIVTYWIDAYLSLFPDARIISVVRDPRRAVPIVARRQRKKIETQQRYGTISAIHHSELLDIMTRRWLESWRVIDRLRRNGKTLLVQFEEFCRAPDSVLSEIFAGLGHPGVRSTLAIQVNRSGSSGAEGYRVQRCLRELVEPEEYRRIPYAED